MHKKGTLGRARWVLRFNMLTVTQDGQTGHQRVARAEYTGTRGVQKTIAKINVELAAGLSATAGVYRVLHDLLRVRAGFKQRPCSPVRAANIARGSIASERV